MSTAGGRPGVAGSSARGGRAGGRPRPDRRPGQQRRRDGDALLTDGRRPLAADGDQPLRPVPARPACCCPSSRRVARAGSSPSPARCTALPVAHRSATRTSSRASTPGGARYSETKLANLLFTFELDRRAAAAALPVSGAGGAPRAGRHPPGRQRPVRPASGGLATILDAAAKAVSQSAAMGALPVLMAATADLPGSTYCGPSGFNESRGLPTTVGCSALARDPDLARRLWELSEETVGLRWPRGRYSHRPGRGGTAAAVTSTRPRWRSARHRHHHQRAEQPQPADDGAGEERTPVQPSPHASIRPAVLTRPSRCSGVTCWR